MCALFEPGRYAAAMALAYQIWKDDPHQKDFAVRCLQAGKEVYELGRAKPGVQQGNSYGSPYRYEETTWADDMEWGAAELFRATHNNRYLEEAKRYAKLAADENWMGKEQTGHYQYYPFMNVGHFRLYDLVDRKTQKELAALVDRAARTIQSVELGQLPLSDDLALAPPHPPRVHLTYLDPGHRAAGGRWHDAVTIGDAMTPAYRPELVIISENKDTAIHFPPRARAISVEGVGRGAGAVAAVDWLAQAPTVIYWGDMDADGLEILNEFRAAGIAAHSMFMDPSAYQRWERFGATVDPHGRPLEADARHPVPHLTDDERRLYDSLTDPAWPGVRRIEQERIPLALALAEVERLAVSGTEPRSSR